MQRSSVSGGRRPQGPRYAFSLEHSAPERNADGFFIILTAWFFRDRQGLGNQEVNFSVEGSTVAHATTTFNGRANARIALPLEAAGKAVLLGAQIAGTSWRDEISVALPAASKETGGKAEELVVHPTRVENTINMFVRVLDAESCGVKNAKLTIIENNAGRTETCDGAGEFLLSFSLAPGEEREISIWAAGVGSGFARTFRGREV